MKNALIIPFMTLALIVAILLNIPIFRDVIAFAYLSFVPGFAILKTFKLKKLNLLKTFLISVGLSLFTSMFVGFLVNELYVILGLSAPLSTIPLMAAISTFTLVLFFIGFKRDFSIDFVSMNGMSKEMRTYLPLAIVLIILPTLGVVGALYANIPIMIILHLTIAVLCVLSIASDRLVPSKSYPFLIFSISISIVLVEILMSRYIIGDDAHLEYYIFKVTQTNGYWGSIDAATHYQVASTYNSMLSITLLPNVYSILMNLKNEILFKILYPFILSLVPVTLYGMYRKETGKLIGLLSTFFFIFSVNGFFGELTNVNRQIVGEFFLVLSVFLWLDKTLPLREKRILLIIFGLSLAVSHYSLAVIYLVFISLIIIVSSIKTKFDHVFNAQTFLVIAGGTFLWQAFSPGSTLITIIDVFQRAMADLITFSSVTSGSAAVVYAIPGVFTAASWINLIMEGVVILSLVIGILTVILSSKKKAISFLYVWITIFGAFLLAVSFLFPRLASVVNFTRLYGVSLLFLSPCFAIGALSFLRVIQHKLRNRGQKDKSNIYVPNKFGKAAPLLVIILLSVYFFSQSGMVNYVTNGGIKASIFDYYRMQRSNDTREQAQFYSSYTPVQDAFSAIWLSRNTYTLPIVYSDPLSTVHVLYSKGLIPSNLIRPLTNSTEPEQGNFIYLDSLNVVKGIIPTLSGSLNTLNISSSLDKSSLVYSNGNSEIYIIVG